MGRIINKRKAPKRAVVVIVDGQDEQMYLEQAKCYYCSSKPELRSIKVKPELPEKKRKRRSMNYLILQKRNFKKSTRMLF